MTSTWSRRTCSSYTAFRLVMLVLALLIVLHWKIGPVLVRVDLPGAARGAHGIHLGDGLALLPALLAVPLRLRRLDRRVGIKAPVTPGPMRRVSDRAPGA